MSFGARTTLAAAFLAALLIGATGNAQAVTFSYTGPPVPIPDAGPRVSAPIAVTGIAQPVGKVTMSIDGTACTAAYPSSTVGIEHYLQGELLLTLRSPGGTEVLVINRKYDTNFGPSGFSNFCQVVLDDDSSGPSIQDAVDAPFTGNWKPNAPLSAFAGEAANGNWTLFAQDVVPGDTGTIRAWSINILRGSSTTLGSSLNPSVFGAGVTLTAGVTGTAPTGSVDFIDGASTVLCAAVPLATGSAACTISNLSVGAHSVTARYSGDGSNAASTSAPVSQTVNKAATSSSVSAPASATVGQPVAVTATLAVTAPGAGTPTGTIAVSTSSGAATCTITLPATSCSLTPTGAGSQTLTAAYAGDGNFEASSGSTTILGAGQGQTISFTSTPPQTPLVGSTYAVAATATSGLPVSFVLAAGSAAGACTISASSVTFTGAGNCIVAASQAGNATFAAAPTVTQSVTVRSGEVAAVPTLNEWMLMLLAGLMSIFAIARLRRR
ncbi:MAG: IPTL-CTERM sorting domain-containing protein [Burkholderiales bacterium]